MINLMLGLAIVMVLAVGSALASLIRGDPGSAPSIPGFVYVFLGYVLYRAAWGRIARTTGTA